MPSSDAKPRGLRIVGGLHRGRRLVAPPGELVRPTSDRAREALFNILSHGNFAASGLPFAGRPVLDAFAGTGPLRLEALSRGAGHAPNHPPPGRAGGANPARLWPGAPGMGGGPPAAPPGGTPRKAPARSAATPESTQPSCPPRAPPGSSPPAPPRGSATASS